MGVTEHVASDFEFTSGCFYPKATALVCQISQIFVWRQCCHPNHRTLYHMYKYYRVVTLTNGYSPRWRSCYTGWSCLYSLEIVNAWVNDLAPNQMSRTCQDIGLTSKTALYEPAVVSRVCKVKTVISQRWCCTWVEWIWRWCLRGRLCSWLMKNKKQSNVFPLFTLIPAPNEAFSLSRRSFFFRN